MKENSQLLLDNLTENIYEAQLKEMESKNPEAFHGDVNISEAIEHFDECKSILSDSITSGEFEKLSYKSRTDIKASLEKIRQQRYNSSHLIKETENFCDLIYRSGILNLGDSGQQYLNKLGELKQLNKRLNSSLKKIDKSEDIIDQLKIKEDELDLLTTKINDLQVSMQLFNEESKKVKDSIDEQHKEGGKNLENIKALEEQVESKKVAIESFKNNIDEYKIQIDNLQDRALYVVDSKTAIDQILQEARAALSLTSTVGLSAALSEQYKKASDIKLLKPWIVGSIFFLFIALIISIWIISGWGINDNDGWSQLVGRIVIIAISISAATFCAQQYVKQKNLIEDYAYKLTLAKSIIAFKDEIQKVDPKSASEYLTSVLNEIHQDPLRVRVKQKELTLSEKSIGAIQKAIVSMKETVS